MNGIIHSLYETVFSGEMLYDLLPLLEARLYALLLPLA